MELCLARRNFRYSDETEPRFSQPYLFSSFKFLKSFFSISKRNSSSTSDSVIREIESENGIVLV